MVGGVSEPYFGTWSPPGRPGGPADQVEFCTLCWSVELVLGTCGGLAVKLVEFRPDRLRLEVGVVHQHAVVPVSADQCHLGHGQPQLKQSGDGFVAKVVKADVFEPCPAEQPPPALGERAWRDWKHKGALIRAIERGEDGDGCGAERNGAGATVLGLRDMEQTCLGIDVVPAQRQQLTPPHGGFDGKLQEGNEDRRAAPCGGFLQLQQRRFGNAAGRAVIAFGFADPGQRVGGERQSPLLDGDTEHVLEDAKLAADGCRADFAQPLVPVECKVLGSDLGQWYCRQLTAQEGVEDDGFNVRAAFPRDLLVAVAAHEIGEHQSVHRDRRLPGLDPLEPGFFLACPGIRLSSAIEAPGQGGMTLSPDLGVPFPAPSADCSHVGLRIVPAVCQNENGGRL